MTRFIFINRYFFPDLSATSQILSDLAFHLASKGKDIHIITSRQRYEDAQARLPSEETIRGVQIHRAESTRFGRGKLIGRGIDYLSFYASVRSKLLELARPGDVVIAKTDPPLLSIIAMSAAKRQGARLINWLQDLYPEVAAQLDVPFVKGPIGRSLKWLRDRSLMFASANIAVGQKMAAKLAATGVAADRVRVIPNWTNDEDIVPVEHATNPLRSSWGLAEKFVVGYSGNLGRAHEFDTVLDAAKKMRGDPQIVFLFIGGGHSFDELARQVKVNGLDGTFRFVPYQDREHLKFSLGVPDVHLLSLRPELEGLIVPSKFYGIAAAGRPILAITAKDGEFTDLIAQHRCGLVVEPGHADELAAALIELSRNERRCVEMGRNARMMLDRDFTRQKEFQRWEELLSTLETH